MEISGWITALFVGVILGLVGRAIAPGKQGIPWWLTILTGIAAAYIGTWVAGLVGWNETSGIDWLELALQVGAAVVGVILVSGVWRSIKGKQPASSE
ncbi:MAG: GlsB/YeaQ/YmgE family stress response membrane protein [Actinophytocola sp.]|nr:GlsB/YeaQ/YmgE family stress response membrane protein [Actinophytocola sp.]